MNGVLATIRHTTILAMVTLVFSGLAACAAEVAGPLDGLEDEFYEAEEDHGHTLGTQQGELSGITSFKWKDAKIPVCWQNPTQANALGRAMSRRAAEETWEKVSSIDFVGWGKCKPCDKYKCKDQPGIRIQVEDSGPHTKGIGNKLNGKSNGMVLNFTFNNWSPACKSSTKKRNSCIKSIAVHEFGHAIGFTHEHNSPDTPGECTQKKQGTTGKPLTPWDIHSVMNYCNPVYNNDGLLSYGDIAGVRKVYGKPSWKSFIDEGYYRGLYADVENANMSAAYHYQKWGGKEGRNPMPFFDGKFYLKVNKDVKNAGVNPFKHFIEHGAMQGRLPHPKFDAKFYVKAHPEIWFTGLSAFEHYVYYGAPRGWKPGANNKWAPSANRKLFDGDFYKATYPDIANHSFYKHFPLKHFLKHGQKENRSPSADYDSKYYLAKHIGLKSFIQAGWIKSAFSHWIIWGINEGRQTTK